jgi:hypothetical protein
MRWHATIFYRTDAGSLDVQHDFEELCELDELVEAGPHWGTIEQIVIKYAGGVEADLTVEEAAAL